GRVVGVDERAVRVVVDLLLAGDDGVVEAACGVGPRRARGRTRLVLLAEREVVLPGGGLRGEGGGVGGQARLAEQVAAVAQRHRADVGAEAQHGALLGGGRFLLPRQVARDGRARGGVAQVGPQVLLVGHHVGDAGDLDALHVGGALAGGEAGLQGGPVGVLALRRVVLDRDAGVLLLVLGEQARLLVAERAEQADGQLDRPGGGLRGGSAGPAAGRHRQRDSGG